MKHTSSRQAGIYTYIGELDANNQFTAGGTLIHPSGNIDKIAATDNNPYIQPDLSLDCRDVSIDFDKLLESIEIPDASAEANNNGKQAFKLRLLQHASATDSDIHLTDDSVKQFIQKIYQAGYTDIEIEDSACNAPITRFLLSDEGKQALIATNINGLKLTLSHSNLTGSYSSVILKHDPTTGNSRPYLVGSQGNRKELLSTTFHLTNGKLTINSELLTAKTDDQNKEATSLYNNINNKNTLFNRLKTLFDNDKYQKLEEICNDYEKKLQDGIAIPRRIAKEELTDFIKYNLKKLDSLEDIKLIFNNIDFSTIIYANGGRRNEGHQFVLFFSERADMLRHIILNKISNNSFKEKNQLKELIKNIGLKEEENYITRDICFPEQDLFEKIKSLFTQSIHSQLQEHCNKFNEASFKENKNIKNNILELITKTNLNNFTLENLKTIYDLCDFNLNDNLSIIAEIINDKLDSFENKNQLDSFIEEHNLDKKYLEFIFSTHDLDTLSKSINKFYANEKYDAEFIYNICEYNINLKKNSSQNLILLINKIYSSSSNDFVKKELIEIFITSNRSFITKNNYLDLKPLFAKEENQESNPSYIEDDNVALDLIKILQSNILENSQNPEKDVMELIGNRVNSKYSFIVSNIDSFLNTAESVDNKFFIEEATTDFKQKFGELDFNKKENIIKIISYYDIAGKSDALKDFITQDAKNFITKNCNEKEIIKYSKSKENNNKKLYITNNEIDKIKKIFLTDQNDLSNKFEDNFTDLSKLTEYFREKLDNIKSPRHKDGKNINKADFKSILTKQKKSLENIMRAILMR